jgi:diaminopimelate decarboxylase
MDVSAFEELARAYGTPYFLYDADEIHRRIKTVRQALSGMVDVFYAVKAKPNLELLRAVAGTADGLDISSGGELAQALLAGFDPATLSFAGPAKTTLELTEAIQRGVGCISVESKRELLECVQIAQRLDVRANIAIRVNPVSPNRSFGIKMGGKAVQFGIDEENLDEILHTVVAHRDELDFRGIHVYAGSQCFDSAGVADGVADTFRIVREIETSTTLVCRVINLGGGFGVSHVDHRELDLKAMAAGVVPLVRELTNGASFQRKVVFELGRYLTANAGIYVCRVISSKHSRGKNFYAVDGGLHHHLAAAGTFGAALRSNFKLCNLTRPSAETIRCQIAGPSCNPTDLLGVDMELPHPEHGDLLGVLSAGSYGLTASPLLFLGRQTPAELVRRRGVVSLGRRPRPMTDFN